MEFKTKHIPDGRFLATGDFLLDNKKDSGWKRWQESWTWNGNYTPKNAIFLEYHFETPDQSRDQRSETPYKTVHQEYLIMPLVSFAGNVGGTFGMFIGFSFLGTSEWLVWHLSKKGRTLSLENSKKYSLLYDADD